MKILLIVLAVLMVAINGKLIWKIKKSKQKLDQRICRNCIWYMKCENICMVTKEKTSDFFECDR